MIGALKRTISRFGTLPFESLVGALSLISATANLFLPSVVTTTDALNTVLPSLVVRGTWAAYGLAGLALLVGIGAGKGNIQAFGYVVIAVASLNRFIAIIYHVGWNRVVIVPAFLQVAIVLACWARLKLLLHGEAVARVVPE